MAEKEYNRPVLAGAQTDRAKKDKKSKLRKKSDVQTQETEENILTDVDIPLECAVCLQSCIQPVKLPCEHIFCFLCVKGVANQSKRCALCRKEIPIEFLNCPVLVKSCKDEIEPEPEVELEEGYQWYYEGRNGWWQYDERASVELEDAYKSKNRCIELLIAGFLYVIDFENMIQIRRNDPTRRRRIKRDLRNAPKKGIAGIKYFPSEKNSSDDRQGDGDEETEDTSGQAPKGKKVQRKPGSGNVDTMATRFSAMTVGENREEEEEDLVLLTDEQNSSENSSGDQAPGAVGGSY
ncbi:E3 ubiquitin-protein ligase RNF146-like [Saccoglossus kowalevskii]|uniref:E3 ubiquitin-protein ligase n=1 Tax=Saccoglossus kowalevskii TaxID=10224 RepID=A0ABM0GQE9_SACKO|nr:PREDICTED: E3 ubiquitin-protein ligase rnf146-like [Saccoglossus kowalevskii]